MWRFLTLAIASLLWLVCTASFVPRDARAADTRYGVVTLDLRLEAGEVPTHLCVVSEAKSPRARKTLWEVLEDEPESRAAPGSLTGGLSWRVRPEVWNGDEASTESQRCGDDPLLDCRPRVSLPEGLSATSDLFVACTADSLSDSGTTKDPRPLFVLLEYLEGSPPQLESVRLTGGVATIGVLRANFDHVIVTARSLGGQYLPDSRSQRATIEGTRPDGTDGALSTKFVSLDLVPRCQSAEIKLPRTKIRPKDRERLDVRVHGKKLFVDRCVDNLVGSNVFSIRMPPAPLGVGSVDVELRDAGEGQAAARFGGNFEGKWPKTPFALELNQVTFSWRRPDCIYPDDECPSAVLSTGTTCRATVTEEGCAYRCPGDMPPDGAIDLEFPLQVTFEKQDPIQRWTDILAQNGQELASYVASDQTYLQANLIGWEVDDPDNRIEDLIIFGEDGEARRYGITRFDTMQLKIPGASCEVVRFVPKGDRKYDEVVATVDDGQIDFGNPHRSARRISFNLTLAAGGGPAWSAGVETPPLYFSGLGMFALHIRPRKEGWRRVGFEFRAGGTLGRWGQTERGEVDTETRIGWARVLFEPAIVGSVHERLALGAGLGLGFSLPFRSQNETLGDSLNFIWSPNIDLRFRVRSWLRLVVQFRGVFGEEAFFIESGSGNNPDPSMTEQETERARSLLTLFGLVFSF